MPKLVLHTLERKKHFKLLSLESLQDTRLSWKAKAIHLYLMSRPEGWDVIHADLIARSIEGREAVNNGIKELKRLGYLNIESERDEQGTIKHWTWYATESPKDAPLKNTQITRIPEVVHPQSENQHQKLMDFHKTADQHSGSASGY